MPKWILTTLLSAALLSLALTPTPGFSQVVVVQPPPPMPPPPPPPPPPGSIPPQAVVYRVYYTHPLRPRRIHLYGTYTNLQHAEQAVNWLNAHPRFNAYIN